LYQRAIEPDNHETHKLPVGIGLEEKIRSNCREPSGTQESGSARRTYDLFSLFRSTFMKPSGYSSLALVVLLACSVPSPAQEVMASTSYFPLRVGTSWDYHVNSNLYTLRVTKHERIKDDKNNINALCARVEMLVAGKPVTVEHLRVTRDGVYRVALDGKVNHPPVQILKLPPTKGTSWKVESTLNAGTSESKFTGEFTIGREDVTIGEKTYPNCIKVTGNDLQVAGSKVSAVYYFAEGVGLVKQKLDFEGQKMILELDQFNPPK
jgi:hypothetical protein